MFSRSIKVKEEQKETYQQEEKQLAKERNTRSRSYLKERTVTPQKYEKEDEKFTKIQNKINKFNDRVIFLAEEKKKLNIDFKLNKPESSGIRREDPASSNLTKTSKSKNKLPEVEIVESHRNNHTEPNNDS